MYFILSEKVFLVKSCGLGKHVNKMLFLLHIPSALLSSHHFFSCRSVQLLQLNYCQSLLQLLSNASALCLIYCFVRTPQLMSPWLFSSDILDNMGAGFSLGLRHVNWGLCLSYRRKSVAKLSLKVGASCQLRRASTSSISIKDSQAWRRSHGRSSGEAGPSRRPYSI